MPETPVEPANMLPVASPEPSPVSIPMKQVTADAASPQAAAAAGMQFLRAFLEGAGLPAAHLSAHDAAEGLRNYGQIFRELVSGIRELLAVRTLTKSEFHIDQTVIRPSDNNPLKFSVDLEQAVCAAAPATVRLCGTAARYPPSHSRPQVARAVRHCGDAKVGDEAAEIAFAGRGGAAYRGGRSAGQPAAGGRKARYWEAYETVYHEVADEFREDVQNGFRQAFAEAYFEQVKKL